MTTYSPWQSGKLFPKGKGFYELKLSEKEEQYKREIRLKYGLPDEPSYHYFCLELSRWFYVYKHSVGSVSDFQTHNGDEWQWRGIL